MSNAAKRRKKPLTDPSKIASRWVRFVESELPKKIRNTAKWRAALRKLEICGNEPAAERRRKELLLDWLWTKVMPTLQPRATACGIAREWRKMCKQRTRKVTAETTETLRSIYMRLYAVGMVARAALAAIDSDSNYADPGYYTAVAATNAARGATKCWADWDPAGLLQQLVSQ